MTVAIGISVKIFLVVFLGGIEVPEWRQLHRQRLTGFLLLAGIDGFDLRQLILLRIVDAGAILNTTVVALTVDGERVDNHEVIIQQLGQGNSGVVIADVDRLRVSAGGADIPIAGIFARPVCVAGLSIDNALKLVEELLHAPKAAAGKIDVFHFGRNLLGFHYYGYWLNRKI